MTFDLHDILKSKRALRRELAARPVAEKLRMLDALRERAPALRPAKPAPSAGVVAREAAVLRQIRRCLACSALSPRLPEPRQKTDVPTLMPSLMWP